MRFFIFGVISLALLVGCNSEPTIDGSSQSAYEESMARVLESLEPDEAQQLLGAIMQLGVANINLANPDKTTAAMMSELHGKTAAEIILVAQNRRSMAEAQAIQRDLEKLNELQAIEQAEVDALDRLQTISIKGARVEQRRDTFGLTTTLFLTVTNGLDVPISRLYWEKTVISPGRSVPWLKEDTNYSISGGLEPGETAEWRLNPGFSWRNTSFPEDAELQVSVWRADGADGEPILNARQLSDYDRSRLATLREEHEG